MMLHPSRRGAVWAVLALVHVGHVAVGAEVDDRGVSSLQRSSNQIDAALIGGRANGDLNIFRRVKSVKPGHAGLH